MTKRGLLIVLEGIDGSGKSEQAERLAAWLRSRGESVVKTHEPTDGPWGQRYRAWARGEAQASAEEVLGFFEEDRAEHVRDVIAPALRAGALVVCDRYVASTLAYQAAQGLERERLQQRMKERGFPEPDLELWLALPVDEALSRLGSGAEERFERRAFLSRVAREYRALGLEAVDAARPREEVQEEIRARVAALLTGAASG